MKNAISLIIFSVSILLLYLKYSEYYYLINLDLLANLCNYVANPDICLALSVEVPHGLSAAESLGLSAPESLGLSAPESVALSAAEPVASSAAEPAASSAPGPVSH
jgi:hypothetical protein